MALNSLHTLDESKLADYVDINGSGAHPTLFEIMPQQGIQASGKSTYDDHLLRNLRRYTWIGKLRKLPAFWGDASSPLGTPFFLIGLDVDALAVENYRNANLVPNSGGRIPDIVLIDLSRSARDRLGHDWRKTVSRFLNTTLYEVYLDACPPVLAVTDDPQYCHALQYDIREFDHERAKDLRRNVRDNRVQLVLTSRRDVFHDFRTARGPRQLSIEAYGSDLLDLAAQARILRRAYLDEANNEIAESISECNFAAQSIAALPGEVNQFLGEFGRAHYDGNDLQRIGRRFDYLTPRGKLHEALKDGLGGRHQQLLSNFVSTLDTICTAAIEGDSGQRRFDALLSTLQKATGETWLVLPNPTQRVFVEWRLENDSRLKDLKCLLEASVVVLDRRELVSELEAVGEQSASINVVFIEPSADDLLPILMSASCPGCILLTCNLARVEQLLKRVKILLGLEGVAPVQTILTGLQSSLEKALSGHNVEFSEGDYEPQTFRFGTLDLTADNPHSTAPIWSIETSSRLRIRAYEGTEFALYDPDSIQKFSRRLLRDLQPGDQICVFDADFVATARDKLKLKAAAPEILRKYHNEIAEAVERLSGSDLTDKARAIRARMAAAEPQIDIPGVDDVRRWMKVANLVDAPRTMVVPQAPRYRRQYLGFTSALGISKTVAEYFWDFGILLTRSDRIRTGSSFHDVFMGILIDPTGTLSRLPPEVRSEVWRVHHAAEEHVATIESIKPGSIE